MQKYFIWFLMCFVCSFLLTPLVKKLAIKVNAIDVPKDERRVHKKPIPRLGGLAIYFAFIIGILISDFDINHSELGIILGVTLIVVGGVIDDIKTLKPLYKLLFQIASALILISFGIKIKIVTNPFNFSQPFFNLNYFQIPLTIIWIVGVTNAFNLIDGLDGLSAGIAFISSTTLFIIAVLNGRYEAAALTAIFSGSLLGFIPYNFNPASIFMGDTGAQLAGFLLATISIEGTIKSAATFALYVPILAFGLPIYDTIFAMVRRKINGKPIMQGDRGHLHHRLLDMGLSQKQAVIVMYFISCVLGGMAIIAMQISTQRAYFLTSSVIIITAFLAWKFGFFKHKQ